MTELKERKFTPPTTFPQEYVTTGGRKAFIYAIIPDDHRISPDILMGQSWGIDGLPVMRTWFINGSRYGHYQASYDDLHDLPKKEARWANVYEEMVMSLYHESRSSADRHATENRIGVIRMEREEGKMPKFYQGDV